MIKFEHPEVWGWEHAIRGMRNPLNSWDTLRQLSGGCTAESCCESVDREGICYAEGVR